MISIDGIKAIITKMCSDINVTFMREQQGMENPEFPYLSYLVTSFDPDKSHQNYRATALDTEDPTKVVITTMRKSKDTISITVHDKNRMDRIATLAKNALIWFGTIAGKEFCYANGYRVVQASSVQNRSIFMDGMYWDNKFGFDLFFYTASDSTEKIETVQEIDLQPVENDVVLADITT